MKKIFTLFTMAALAFGAYADDTTIWEGTAKFDSWEVNVSLPAASFATLSLDDEIIFTASEVFDLEDWKWGNQLLFKKGEWSGDFDPSIVLSVPEGAALPTELSYRVVEEDVLASLQDKGLILQGQELTITKVVLRNALEYGEPKELEMDEWGTILASAFEGYSDDAIVNFNYNVSGELTNADGSIVGWGIGVIQSLGGKVTVADIPASKLGDLTLTVPVSKIRPALADGPNEYDQYGINWNVWNQGNAIVKRIKVEIREVAGEEGTDSIQSVAAPAVEDNAIYNIMGVRVDANYKGLVIKGGKKYIQR